MDIIIEVDDKRRIINKGGIKIYGSAEELRLIRDAIEIALNKGLVVGWIGVGAVDKETVFPKNGLPNVPTFQWDDKAEVV